MAKNIPWYFLDSYLHRFKTKLDRVKRSEVGKKNTQRSCFFTSSTLRLPYPSMEACLFISAACASEICTQTQANVTLHRRQTYAEWVLQPYWSKCITVSYGRFTVFGRACLQSATRSESEKNCDQRWALRLWSDLGSFAWIFGFIFELSQNRENRVKNSLRSASIANDRQKFKLT